MTLIRKLIPFVAIFSAVFYVVRTSDAYNVRLLIANIDGVPWLYATIGTLFGVLAAFVIQKEWGEWDALTQAVRGEVDGLEKLYLWSSHFPENIKEKIHTNIRRYLDLIVREGWSYSKRGEKSREIEDIIMDLNASIYEIFDEAPQLMPTSFALLSNILGHRSSRLEYSRQHMPPLLKDTLRFAAFLLIGLSLGIGIKDFWLDYIFTASIATLSFSIFLVLLDLDNPLEPGDWHITTKDYEALLAKITIKSPTT